MITEDNIHSLLKSVKDPEIPVLSVVDMGIVQNVRVQDNKVALDLVPTFAGCPAIQMMKEDIEKTCRDAGADEVVVNVVRNRSWSTNQMSAKGKQRLKEFGISPPPEVEGEVTLEMLEHAVCPVCGSTNTELRNSFGPTACRAIHFCKDCHETFEQMKPL